MLSEEDRFKSYLTARRLKFTAERQAVLDRVFATHRHFEADELLVDLRHNDLKISKATIYRTLSLLVKSGLLREVIFGERHMHYEHVHGYEHHDHMVCNKCGKIVEFIDDRIEALQIEVCKKNKFQAESHRLQIQGLCEVCCNAGDVAKENNVRMTGE